MSLSKVQNAGFREYETYGMPIINVAGLECISLWRLQDFFGKDRKATLKMLATKTPEQPLFSKDAK